MSTLAAETSRAIRTWVPDGTTRRQKVTVIALVLIVVQTAVRGWAILGGWFYGDDLEWLSSVAHGDAGLGWIFSPHDSQFMPVGLGLAWLVGESGAYVWPLAAAETIVLQLVAAVLCWRMLVVFFGHARRALVLLTVYLFATLTLPAVMWWAVALNQLPLHIAFFGAAAAHVQFLRTRRPLHVLTASLWLTFGYLAYVKTLLMVFVLVMVAVLFFVRGRPVPRVLEALRRYWLAWVAYGAVTAAYLYVYVVYVPSPIDNEGDFAYGTLADTLLRQSLGPGLLGGPWRWFEGNAPVYAAETPEILVTGSWLFLFVLGTYLVVTRRGAAKVLLIAVPYLLVTLYLVGEGRAWALGDFAGREYRYLADFAALVPLLAGLMWLPVRGAEDPVERRHPSIRPPAWLRPVLCVAFVVSTVVSSLPYVRAWHDDYPTRSFIAHARGSLDDAVSPPVIADVPVPVEDLGSQMFPSNLPSAFLAPVGDQFSTDVPANDVMTFDPDGTIVRAAIGDGISTTPQPTSPCGLVVEDEPVTVTLGATTLDFPFWAGIGYLAGGNGRATVVLGERSYEAPVQAGLHTLFLPTHGAFDTVTIVPETGTAMCIDTIDIGPLEAR